MEDYSQNKMIPLSVQYININARYQDVDIEDLFSDGSLNESLNLTPEDRKNLVNSLLEGLKPYHMFSFDLLSYIEEGITVERPVRSPVYYFRNKLEDVISKCFGGLNLI